MRAMEVQQQCQRRTRGRQTRERRLRASSLQHVTDRVSQAVVQGLTRLLPQSNARAAPLRSDVQSPEELRDILHDDVATREYLWTGQLSLSVFDRSCVFSDPTLSFTSPDKFARNAESLDRISKNLLLSQAVALRDVELNKDDKAIVIWWRMVGDLKLPWKPRVDVSGRTVFSYDGKPPPERVDVSDEPLRIVRYDEQWETDSFDALMQLFRPGPPGAAREILLQDEREVA